MEHYPRATKVLAEDGSIVGYDAGCSCSWRGRHFPIEDFGTVAARTCALIVGNGHVFSETERTA